MFVRTPKIEEIVEETWLEMEWNSIWSILDWSESEPLKQLFEFVADKLWVSVERVLSSGQMEMFVEWLADTVMRTVIHDIREKKEIRKSDFFSKEAVKTSVIWSTERNRNSAAKDVVAYDIEIPLFWYELKETLLSMVWVWEDFDALAFWNNQLVSLLKRKHKFTALGFNYFIVKRDSEEFWVNYSVLRIYKKAKKPKRSSYRWHIKWQKISTWKHTYERSDYELENFFKEEKMLEWRFFFALDDWTAWDSFLKTD